MIEVVTPNIAFLYRHKLEAMYRLRHRVFKERMDWAVNSREGRERDVYDLLGPIYLLATNNQGEVQGTCRLLPTTGPYMLKDVFPDLLDGESSPVHPQVWEPSRLAVDFASGDREQQTAQYRVMSDLLAGLFEWGTLFGIREFIAVYDVKMGRILRRAGCPPTWESTPKRIGNTTSVAGRFEVSDRVLDTIRQVGHITEPVLVHQDAILAHYDSMEVRHAA